MRRNIFLSLFTLLFIACTPKSEPVKFAIISDLHTDIMPDAQDRLEQFLNEAENNQVDFIVNLGDLLNANAKNKQLAKTWSSHSIKKYNVLGNHDMDVCTKDEFMAYIDMPKPYYSFDDGVFHFVVLDANHILKGDEYIDYQYANFYIDASKRGFIDPEQLKWLNDDLASSDRPCIIFSHQSLERPQACGNAEVVRSILEKHKLSDGSLKVKVAFSGHDHTDYMKEINGISYIQINSASNQWLGADYATTERYTEEDNINYPNLRKTAPYTDALFATVTVDAEEISVKGVQSSFISPGPEDLGIKGEAIHGLPLVPKISDYSIKLK